MYTNSNGQTVPPSGLSNNPFIEDPTTAHARFPDLTASNFQPAYPNHQQYNSQLYPQPYGPGGPYQTQPMQAISPQSQFTSTSYTPQYQGQLNLAAFQSTAGVPQQQQQQQQQQQYPIPSGHPYSSVSTSYQPTNAAPGYLAEFDPYGQLQPTHVAPSSSGTGPTGVSHPRDLIRIHKSGLEAWDAYSWKQLFSACDALKEAWSARKQQAQGVVRQYGGLSDPGLFGSGSDLAYNGQVEGWKLVLKDASDNFDTVAASTFQLHEVFNSYRQSGDQASKRRVRESCNAAVNGLPDWPSN